MTPCITNYARSVDMYISRWDSKIREACDVTRLPTMDSLRSPKRPPYVIPERGHGSYWPRPAEESQLPDAGSVGF